MLDRKFGLALGVAAVLFGALGFAPADDPAKTDDARKTPTPPPKKKAGGGDPNAMLPALLAGIKSTPGCLGVETARTSGGKSVIFAWFKDKTSIMAWYNSRVHKSLMNTMIEGRSGRKPLENLKDDGRPVMAIASLTFSDKPKLEGVNMPISQISIEIYQPVDGGISLGGTFAPAGMEIPKPKDEPAPKN